MGRPSQGEQKDPKVWSGGYLVPREAHKEVEASVISQNALLNSLPPAIQHSPVVWLSGKATLPTMRPDEDTELSATHLQLCGPGPALFKVSVHSCHSAFLGSPPYPKVAHASEISVLRVPWILLPQALPHYYYTAWGCW